MKTVFAKWFFSKAIDEDKASAKFAKNHFEKSQSFRKWAKEIATVDEQLKASVSEANHKPSPKLHQRTMDALHENAFTIDETSRGYFFLTRPFATASICAVLIISTFAIINLSKQNQVKHQSEIPTIVTKWNNGELRDQSRALMVSYMYQPLIREGQALLAETQRAGERLWERFPLKPQIIPASYTPEKD